MRDDAQAGIERPVEFGSLSAVLTVALGMIFIGVREFFYPGVAAAGPGFRFGTGAMATCSGSKGRVM
jgi:hypothetical protein